MTGKPRFELAPKLANVCRRSWSLKLPSPEWRRIASQGRFKSTSGAPGLFPAITNGLSATRGSDASTDRAGAFNRIVLRPVLLSGRCRAPRSKSTSLHRRFRISRRRAPVKRSKCRAAAAWGETTARSSFTGARLSVRALVGRPWVSACRSVAPSVSSSSSERYRSRRSSRYRSIWRTGFSSRGMSPRRPAHPNRLPRIVSVRLA